MAVLIEMLMRLPLEDAVVPPTRTLLSQASTSPQGGGGVFDNWRPPAGFTGGAKVEHGRALGLPPKQLFSIKMVGKGPNAPPGFVEDLGLDRLRHLFRQPDGACVPNDFHVRRLVRHLHLVEWNPLHPTR